LSLYDEYEVEEEEGDLEDEGIGRRARRGVRGWFELVFEDIDTM